MEREEPTERTVRRHGPATVAAARRRLVRIGSPRRLATPALAAALVAFSLSVAGPHGALSESARRNAASGDDRPAAVQETSVASGAVAALASSRTSVQANPAQANALEAPAPPPADPSVRLWPLLVGTYWFSQAYGCVPQLGYYAEVAGCPPSAPAFHTGIDLAAPFGTVIYAAASGTVVAAGLDRPDAPANSWIVIQHDGANAGWSTEYVHWQVAYVRPGDYVVAGQPIAEVGAVGFATGPHLHFGVIDAAGMLIDPLAWLPADPASGAA